MFYTFNISKFVKQMLPPLLRSGALIALLEVMVTPLKSLYERFLSYRATTSDALNINGHVLPLEMALNKACYTDLIYIESTNTRHGTFLYHESENLPSPYLYNEAEGAEPLILYFEADAPKDVNFIVYIPQSICTNLDDKAVDAFHWYYLNIVKSLLDRYKAAGTTYEIRLIA